MGINFDIEPNSFLTFTLPPNATNQVQLSSVALFVTAVVFQVHTDFTIDKDGKQGKRGLVSIGPDSSNTGTYSDSALYGSSVGFVRRLQTGQYSAGCSVTNTSPDTPVTVQIGATTLTKADPVPGGCSMEFSLPYVPMLLHSYSGLGTPKYFSPKTNFSSKVVEIGWAGADEPFSRTDSEGHCDDKDRLLSDKVSYNLYASFLDINIRNLDKKTLFPRLQNLAQWNSSSFGRKICAISGGVGDKIWLGNWPGRALLLNIVVRNETSKITSPYIPILITGCSSEDPLHCSHNASWDIWIVLGIVAIGGCFLVFIGHYFFRFSQFLVGLAVVGFVIFSILYSFADYLTLIEMFVGSFACGIFGGLLFVFVWESVGSPFLSSLLMALVFGSCVSATISYFALDNWSLLRYSALSHYLSFAAIATIIPALLLYFTKFAHVVSCAGVGAFGVVSTLSVYTGGSVHYIFVRAVERFYLPWFREGHWCFVVPFFTADIVLCVVWVALVLVGVSIQWHVTQHQAPFPPPPLPILTRVSNICSQLCLCLRHTLTSTLPCCCCCSASGSEHDPILDDDHEDTPPPVANGSYPWSTAVTVSIPNSTTRTDADGSYYGAIS